MKKKKYTIDENVNFVAFECAQSKLICATIPLCFFYFNFLDCGFTGRCRYFITCSFKIYVAGNIVLRLRPFSLPFVGEWSENSLQLNTVWWQNRHRTRNEDQCVSFKNNCYELILRTRDLILFSIGIFKHFVYKLELINLYQNKFKIWHKNSITFLVGTFLILFCFVLHVNLLFNWT